MDEPGITVKRENHWFISREDRVEHGIREAMRVLRSWLKSHKIDYVDDSDLEIRNSRAKEVHSGKCLEGGDVAGARHHHIGVPSGIVAGPLPNADSYFAVANRRVYAEPLRRRLLSCNDDVYVMPAAQAVVCDRQKSVRIGRQINTNHVRFLVDHVVEETWILVAEAVVILSPDVGSQKIIQ